VKKSRNCQEERARDIPHAQKHLMRRGNSPRPNLAVNGAQRPSRYLLSDKSLYLSDSSVTVELSE
jgi:hypothetical protein